jgi:hypothetical protein
MTIFVDENAFYPFFYIIPALNRDRQEYFLKDELSAQTAQN